jgi:hypothetical protein
MLLCNERRPTGGICVSSEPNLGTAHSRVVLIVLELSNGIALDVAYYQCETFNIIRVGGVVGLTFRYSHTETLLSHADSFAPARLLGT